MSNLLKSKPDDLTPQGSNPTTIVQKIIEICQSGSKSSRTGTELTSIKEHQNSVFTYKGQPATYVSGADGKFNFAVIDISGESPVMHTYSVDGQKNITQGADVSFDSELPSVSSTDNGKVLKVVEGEWAKADESGGSDLPEVYKFNAGKQLVIDYDPNDTTKYIRADRFPIDSCDFVFSASADDEMYSDSVTVRNESFSLGNVHLEYNGSLLPLSSTEYDPIGNIFRRIEYTGKIGLAGCFNCVNPLTNLEERFKVDYDYHMFFDGDTADQIVQAMGLTLENRSQSTPIIAIHIIDPTASHYEQMFILYITDLGVNGYGLGFVKYNPI